MEKILNLTFYLVRNFFRPKAVLEYTMVFYKGNIALSIFLLQCGFSFT